HAPRWHFRPRKPAASGCQAVVPVKTTAKVGMPVKTTAKATVVKPMVPVKTTAKVIQPSLPTSLSLPVSPPCLSLRQPPFLPRQSPQPSSPHQSLPPPPPPPRPQAPHPPAPRASAPSPPPSSAASSGSPSPGCSSHSCSDGEIVRVNAALGLASPSSILTQRPSAAPPTSATTHPPHCPRRIHASAATSRASMHSVYSGQSAHTTVAAYTPYSYGAGLNASVTPAVAVASPVIFAQLPPAEYYGYRSGTPVPSPGPGYAPAPMQMQMSQGYAVPGYTPSVHLIHSMHSVQSLPQPYGGYPPEMHRQPQNMVQHPGYDQQQHYSTDDAYGGI
ncbi:hypothetical protein C8F01DRAFT_1170916, partial [Mycena amicta]